MKKMALGLCVAVLGGCAVGPEYVRPEVVAPESFKEAWEVAAPQDEVARGAWWTIYKDPVLDGLEEQVAVSNENLKAAQAAYDSARAVVAESEATLFPTLKLNVSTRTQILAI